MGREELISQILAKISKNEYDALDEIVLKFPNDIRVLYYSCILFEQQSCKDDNLAEHISFWKKELENDYAYTALLRGVDETEFSGWPTEIAIEISSCCNAKCRNCTHERLIKSGKRIQEIADKRTIFYRIRKIKLITLLFHSEVGAATPVGLGEPLTHPDIAQIISYMKVFFPNVGFNTNAGLLSEKCAQQLVESGLDYIHLSLSYFDKEIYEREIGLNYDTVINNICKFLEIRKQNKDSIKTVCIHIFNNTLNSKEAIENFKDKFRPLLQENDILEIRQYMEFGESEAKTKIKKRNDVSPCCQLWQVLMVDVRGNMYPCCMGVWKEFDPYLTIGNIQDPIEDVAENLMNLRKKQLEGDMGSCLSCATLRHNYAFRLPLLCYDKTASIHGNIQYKECTLNTSDLLDIEKRIARYDWRFANETEHIVGNE